MGVDHQKEAAEGLIETKGRAPQFLHICRKKQQQQNNDGYSVERPSFDWQRLK